MANYLTQNDVNQYGGDLINVTQRAALQAVSPHLQTLSAQNAQLQQRLAVEARKNLDQRVERAVPNFREIDRQPGWHRYLLGVDELSGRQRQLLLNEAINSGNENRIAAFFRTYQQQAGAQSSAPASTGTTSTTRPGPFARPTSQGSSRVYTRDQIAELYSQHRRGKFSEKAWAAQEADIMAAAREGRIQYPMDWAGK